MLVAGLRGGSGKTLISLGLAASWRKRGLRVAPFKKGPDYIDAAWLTLAARRPCRNLDLFLFSATAAVHSFTEASRDADISLIEGNRGLFDGMDAEGSFSSAELAKLLRAPVLLVVDATKTTRTAAALVLGCQRLDPELALGGVVLNRVAGSRHEGVLRQAIEGLCETPVLGSLPKLPADLFPERHLGLVPPQETEEEEGPLARAAEVAERYLDLEGILELARSAAANGIHEPPARAPVERRRRPRVEIRTASDGGLPSGSVAPAPGTGAAAGAPGAAASGSGAPSTVPGQPEAPIRVGVFRDEAFQFYYPENLEALVAAGAELVEISPLQETALPTVDALYLGGGFPETLAVGLSENTGFMASVAEATREGIPVYAECGGAVYLGQTLRYQGRTYAMAGVLPVSFGFQEKPFGHGYAVLETVAENPFFTVGETLRGHEFHYTLLLSAPPSEIAFAFRMLRGVGFGEGRDGLTVRNVLASYTHLHALGAPTWAPSLVTAARRHRA